VYNNCIHEGYVSLVYNKCTIIVFMKVMFRWCITLFIVIMILLICLYSSNYDMCTSKFSFNKGR